ncbi:MAG TPA: hypothetical protein VG148_17575 [Pyrinomonadaceae bacterium]|nr:hypothetical protein [Pyrinomonadaceae bacterium]
MRPTFFLKACVAALLALGLTRPAPAQEAGRAAQGEAVKGPVVGVRPWEEVARWGQEMVERGRLDLSRDVELQAAAELNEDGTFKPESVSLSPVQDPVLQELAQRLVTALSQSRALRVVNDAEAVHMSLKLDGQVLRFHIAADLPSKERAARLAEAYGLMLQAVRQANRGTDVGLLYEGVRMAADGRRFNFISEVPREVGGRMINEMLARRKAATPRQ